MTYRSEFSVKTRKAIPKQGKPAKDAKYLAGVRNLPCVICEAFGFHQTSPTTVHHTICGRYSGGKTPDRQAIPLCDCHHQGLRFDRDRTKLAIHNGKDSWVEAYGKDTGYIAATQDRILGQ